MTRPAWPPTKGCARRTWVRSSGAPERPPPTSLDVPTERVATAGSSRLVAVGTTAALVFIVVALLKPWNALAPQPAQTTSLAAAQSPASISVPTASPSADPQLLAALNRRQCQSGAGWRLVSEATNQFGPLRTLWFVDQLAQTAREAVDSAPQLRAGEVSAIGFCTPGATQQQRAALAAKVSLWRAGTAGRPDMLERGRVSDQLLARLGEVYEAAPLALSSDGSWPPGTYLFRVASSADSAGGWFALRVVRIGAAGSA